MAVKNERLLVHYGPAYFMDAAASEFQTVEIDAERRCVSNDNDVELLRQQFEQAREHIVKGYALRLIFYDLNISTNPTKFDVFREKTPPLDIWDLECCLAADEFSRIHNVAILAYTTEPLSKMSDAYKKVFDTYQ